MALLSLLTGGCAQIGAPTGGARDSLAPVLVKATPELKKTNVTGNRISLQFNEYIELQDLQNNLLVSPVQQNTPNISSNLRTVSVKLRDSLKPNTTYVIQFGDAIKDVNEGNILKDFTYVFSTGPYIDSLTLSGKLLMAETGLPDSTLMILLYRDAPDSAVKTRKPDFSTRPKGDGSFSFSYLPASNVKVYALKDGDGSKTYNAATELFAFSDKEFNTLDLKEKVTLYAYAKEKSSDKPVSAPKATPEKKLSYTSNQDNRLQDITRDWRFDFNNRISRFDSAGFVLSDTNFNRIPLNAFLPDSLGKSLTIKANWKPETNYILVIDKKAVTDTVGNNLPASDTIRFKTRRLEDYGRLTLRFRNLDLAANPVIQFIQNGNIILSSALASTEYKNNLFIPGEYELRILFDDNRNGRWDPGDYDQGRQPEKARALEQKLAIRADWDNERDIEP